MMSGGEIRSITEMIVDGRHAAINRLEQEARDEGDRGLTGVVSELRKLSGLMEFLAVGSSVKTPGDTGPFFSTACSGQDLYCQVDAGYEPRHFVIGNVAYALGIARGLSGGLKMLARRGEVKEFSDMYNHTRHLALERIENEARERGANAVVDVQTHIIPFGPGVKEMLMVGTASHHPGLGSPARPVTSELTGEELWNLTKIGYAPLRLMLGTSVYALGVTGGIGAFFSSLSRGEVGAVTRLIYEARANCLEHIHKEAEEIGADGVIGTKLYVYEIGSSFVEVLAIGTAVKKHPDVRTASEQLLPQSIIRDRDTFFDREGKLTDRALERK
jgi:uncharacterized protein YbjQ (UPF0145 family)